MGREINTNGLPNFILKLSFTLIALPDAYHQINTDLFSVLSILFQVLIRLNLDFVFIFIPGCFIFYRGLNKNIFNLWSFLSMLSNIWMFTIVVGHSALTNYHHLYYSYWQKIDYSLYFAFLNFDQYNYDAILAWRLILSVSVMCFFSVWTLLKFSSNKRNEQ
jgi:hypothetical protein